MFFKSCSAFFAMWMLNVVKTWRVTEGHREREGRGVKFIESEAEGYEDFLVEKA